jgi:hypothetical protein
MATIDPFATSAGREIPRQVRRASRLVAGCAALSAVGVLAAGDALAHLGPAGEAYLNVVDDHDTALRLLADIHASLVTHLVVSLAGLASLAPLAVAVRRPRPAYRAAAWIAGAIVAVGLGFVIAGGPDLLVSPHGLETPEERRALDDLLPVWYPGLTSLLVTAQAAATIAFSVLLAGTPSGDFYHVPPDGTGGLWTVAPRAE